MNRHILLFVVVTAVWGATIIPVHAVRSDGSERSQTAGRQFPAEREMRRGVSPSQLETARVAAEDGVRVEWNSKLGIPRYVRGLDLGRRRSFSGGKGLAVNAGGRDGKDAIAVLDNLTRFYGIRDAGSEFVPRAPVQDRRGYRHIKVQQIHDGLKVIGGEIVTHFDPDGTAREVNGTYIADIVVATEPQLTPLEALTVAQQDLSTSGNPAGTPVANPELVIFAHRIAPRLAYEVTLLQNDSIGGPGRWRYWIDAMDGSIILCFNDIKRIAAPTTNGADVAISGSMLTGEGGAATNVTGWLQNPSTYYLYSTNRHWFVYNSATSGSYPDLNTYAYRNGTSNWSTNDRVEISAAVCFDTVQRYFSVVHGRDSFDGVSSNARANVHYGNRYVNAYWDGTDFTFGDGDGVEANSLGVRDIAAHEFTHAVTEHSANLFYYGESGALNEAISDIFGVCVEFYSQPNDEASYPNKNAGKADWLVGEDAWISTKALRDLRNPSNPQTVGAGNELPTRYKGTYWSFGSGDNGGVHINSGVQNFFFYLLCKGGVGTNDGLAYNVVGIGLTNAEQIAYSALTEGYMTAYTDYEDARAAWVSAALNSVNPLWATNVEAAWAAVGVGPAPNTVASPVFSPPEDSYVSPTNVTMTTATTNATIYYTLDGAEPTDSSTVYTNPVLISSNTTVKAKAYKTGMNPSLTVSATYTFLGDQLYYFPMNASEGWTVSGQWAFGVPTGGGGAHGSPDPTSGYTGTKVYGYNLSGDYANRINTTYWLTTTPMNLSTSVNVKLVFSRWLGVEQPAYDHAYIEASNNGSTWTRLWENSSEVADASWTRVILDISSVADRQSTVYVRWGMGRTDGSWVYCGWNIDDVAVWGNPVGPVPPPAPSGAHATALSGTEVQVSWLDNSSDEQGFSIERKIGSGSWGEIDRVGLDVTNYLDAAANPAVGPSYRVRAYNAVGYSDYSNTARILIPGQGLPWLLLLLGE